MTKILLQFASLVIGFFVLWFLLSRIDWVDIFQVRETTNKTEQKIGELYVEMIQERESIIKVGSLIQPIIDIIEQITKANDINTDIKLHVIEKDEINAFAIPDDNLILFTGLIKECTSPEELAGVLGHEIAHMEKNHVMKKLVKEVGLSVLISMASGSNGNVIQEIFKTFTSSVFDRKLESEADLLSVKYLQKAEIDYRPFAEFLFRLSLDEDDRLKHLQLMSSHPASEQRATSILESHDPSDVNTMPLPLMTDEKWRAYQTSFVSYSNN